MMMMGLTQASFGTNFVHFLTKGAEHIASIIAECKRQGIVVFEPTPEAEEDWLMTLYGAAAAINPAYFSACTPGYYTSEGATPDAKTARSLGFGSLLDWAAQLEGWRAAGELAGTRVVRSGEKAGDRPV